MIINSLLLPTLVLGFLSDYQVSAVFPPPSSPFRNPPPEQHPPPLPRGEISLARCKAKLTGPIETTLCDYETLESTVGNLHIALHSLVRTPFFKYLKIDLTRECPFWESNGFCVLRDCAVTTVDEHDIPERWRAESLGRLKRSPQADVQKAFPGCTYSESDFCVLDDEDSKTGEYVDLTLNPERFTGYAGPAANQVWSSIYQENCFGLSEADARSDNDNTDQDLLTSSPTGISPLGLSPLVQQSHNVEKEEACLEKKVYYRIISGLHASISTQLCAHSLDQKTGEWRPNLQCFIDRIASHPERLQYMYFNTVILLRAISRAGPYLAAYDLSTGAGQEETTTLTTQLLNQVIAVADSVGQFDETSLFRGEDAKVLKEEFKTHFRNVTRIMDCVGCDKCRLWGKIQTSGIGTALKILFELDEDVLDPIINPHLLQRAEVITLVNTLHQFSESLLAVDQFERMWAARDGVPIERAPANQSNSHHLSGSQSSTQTPASYHRIPDSPQQQNSNGSLLSRVSDACLRGTSACLRAGSKVTRRILDTVFGADGEQRDL